MENTEQITEEKTFQLNNQSILYIRETAKWAKFLSILGFLFIGLIVVLGVLMGVFLPILNDNPDVSTLGASFGGGAIMSIYILIAVVYFFPILYLYRFAKKIITAVDENDESYLESGFMNLKSMFKFMGILSIIMIAVYVLIIVGAILGGVIAGLS